MFGRLLGWYAMFIFFGGSSPLTKFCPVQNSLYVQVLRSPMLAAILHGIPAAGVSRTLRRGIYIQGMELRNFRRGCHLYSVGRSSRWASAHIVVCAIFPKKRLGLQTAGDVQDHSGH